MTKNLRKAAEDAFIASISAGNTTMKAADAAGVDRVTVYRWLQVDPALLARFEDAKKCRMTILDDAMFATAVNGSAALQIFLACNWDPARYKNTQYVDAQIKPGGPVTRLSPSELARIAKGENVVKVLADRKDFKGDK